MERRREGEMERWRDGEMERWRDGEMERWRDGETERGRDGEMERWRDGAQRRQDESVPGNCLNERGKMKYRQIIFRLMYDNQTIRQYFSNALYEYK